jgi:hypothetical protein
MIVDSATKYDFIQHRSGVFDQFSNGIRQGRP